MYVCKLFFQWEVEVKWDFLLYEIFLKLISIKTYFLFKYKKRCYYCVYFQYFASHFKQKQQRKVLGLKVKHQEVFMCFKFRTIRKKYP